MQVQAIKDRQTLVAALQEAAELEHGLLLQYVFAALSLKQSTAETLTPKQEQLVHIWKRTILAIARQEMAHLGTVCNLLSAIGASPRFARPNFPQQAKSFYPLDFKLRRFSDESLFRFIRAELPKGEKPPAGPRQLLDPNHPLRKRGLSEVQALIEPLMSKPDIVPEPLNYDYVGQLYHQIREGICSAKESTLFIGPSNAQDLDNWSRGLALLQVKDRATACSAIDFIVQEGEGSPGHRAGSHYEQFLEIRQQLNDAMNSDFSFEPARPVGDNPRTRDHRDAPVPTGVPVTMITEPRTLTTAELFNAAYKCSIAALCQYYSFGGETVRQRSALQQLAREFMSVVLRPLGEILTTLPATAGGACTAGPPFEFYYEYELPAQISPRWTMLIEDLQTIADGAKYLQKQFRGGSSTIERRLGGIAEDVLLIKATLQSTLGNEFVGDQSN